MRRMLAAAAIVMMLVACGDAPSPDRAAEGGDGGRVAELEEQVAALEAELERTQGALAEAEQRAEEALAQNGNGKSRSETTGEAGADSSADVGSQAAPVPFGETARVADWEVTVLDVTPDATDEVLQYNQFNDPPVEERQFFLVTLRGSYVGDDSGTFWVDLSTSVVDSGNVVYGSDMSRDYCGSIPGNIDNQGETFPGGTVEGTDCWSVVSDNVDSLVMFVEPSFSFDGERVWFAMD